MGRPSADPASWAPSPPTRLLRNPRVYWLAAALLAAITLTTVHRLTSSAQSLRDAYGETTEVFMADAEMATGELVADHARLTSVPLALVPDRAITSIDSADRAAAPISRGTMLTSHDIVAEPSLTAELAALALPIGESTPPLTPGQEVLVVVHADAFTGTLAQTLPAHVHRTGDVQVLLAVRRADLATISAAIAGNGVTIALV